MSLFLRFNRSARRLLNRTGLYAVRAHPDEAASRVLGLLHPYATDHPLIRIGGLGDGGYLVPDDLDGITTCFSPGVSNVANFESDLIERGIRSFLSDFSVEASPIQHHMISFQKRYVGASTHGHFVTLEDWVRDYAEPEDSEMILQMDIEGAE